MGEKPTIDRDTERPGLRRKSRIREILALLMLITFFSCLEGNLEEDHLPVPNRFVISDLISNLNEPMELDFLPDNQIIFIERRGIVKVFDQNEQIAKVIGEIPVSYIYESGLLGIAVDPEYTSSPWVYFFYSPADKPSSFNISRFKVRQDSLILSSEQVILSYYYDHNHCCHNGGGLRFGPDGLLYISTGDNVGGTDYAPIDERPGHYLNDAQRSSANTLDFRGKILRVKPEPGGSYSIPKGNLFDPENKMALPEIYIMGVRNPWKINVDPKTGWLHWGEVGPNPGVRDPQRGPDAQEEFNLAKKAGNFGWPYFVGNNKAYANFNFETGETGEFFDPENVINDSPNNKGLKELPPAQKALIWYPNTLSDTFPLLGTGGGSAVGGPIYRKVLFKNQPHAFPAYYENYWFVADWMRSWIYAVKLDDQGRYVKLESFLEGIPFKKPIDLEFGPDGALYVLDYGSNWYAHNRDARLTRIHYNYGNRAPVAKLKAEKTLAGVPVSLNFSAEGSFDPDEGQQIGYQWFIRGDKIQSIDKQTSHTFDSPGAYDVVLVVHDGQGLTDTASVELLLGNEPAVIDIALQGNQSFYSSESSIKYAVAIQDVEDGTHTQGIDLKSIKVDWRVIPKNVDLTMARSTSAIEDPYFDYLAGKQILEGSDCNGCHAVNESSVGPSLMAVAERFPDSPGSNIYLSQKIRLGGMGGWGTKPMTAHPQHSEEEALEMARYILSLNDDLPEANFPVSGTIRPSDPKRFYLLSASYTDRGGLNAASLLSESKRLLRPYKIHATSFEMANRVVAKEYDEGAGQYAEVMLNGSYIGFREIDLYGIKALRLRMRTNCEWIRLDIKQDAPDGPIIGSKKIDMPPKESRWEQSDWFDLIIPVSGQEGLRDLYIEAHSNRTEGEMIYFDICQLEWIEFMRSELY